jgi:hypothetical protein
MKHYRNPKRISSVETTDDTLTGRGGLALFVRYISQLNLRTLLNGHFGDVRKSSKGLPIWSLFVQVFSWLFDGTSRHLTYFEHLAKDEGYAAAIEHDLKDMASSHAIKRFFKALFFLKYGIRFRRVLAALFAWRLGMQQPEEVELTIDTMVMDNDEAEKRHGVQPTYKKVKGFQPLHLIWNGKIVDAVFRGGKKSGNCGNTVLNMIERNVAIIRRVLDVHVLIVLRLDSGFFDEDIIKACNRLGILLILSGKMYDSVKEHVASERASHWGEYDNGHQQWQYLEFGWRCDSWDHLYRTFYTRPVYEDNGQMLIEFARPDNVIISNAGVIPAVFEHCSEEQREHWLKPETIIASHHSRGADELPHRGLKDFGFQQLPFERFSPNAAVYYCMLIAFFLFETFKEDVIGEVLPDTLPAVSYATTVRRKLIDIAAKIVKTSGTVILKVTQAVMETLKFDQLWERCQQPFPIPLPFI